MIQSKNNNKRKTTKEEIMNLKEGEMLPLIRDFYGRMFFNDYRHKERATFLASIILNMNYKDLEGKVELLPEENNQDKAIYNKTICDIVLDIRLPNSPIILIIELNHFSKDLERLFKDYEIVKPAVIVKEKVRILMKSYFYLNRMYGNQLIENHDYANTKTVIAYNLSTFSIGKESDDIFRFTTSDLKHKIELTDKTQFYNLNVANKSKAWYNGKYQESNKEEKRLILLSRLFTTNKLSIAYDCIDKLNLDMDIKIIKKMKGDLKNMYSKDESELLDNDLVEDEEDYYYQSYLAMRKELLDFAKSDTVIEAETKAREEGLEKGREEGLEKGREEGLEKGREEGLEKGLEKGREETKKDTIITAYKKNIPVATIAEICKTSLAKVNKIIKEYCL